MIAVDHMIVVKAPLHCNNKAPTVFHISVKIVAAAYWVVFCLIKSDATVQTPRANKTKDEKYTATFFLQITDKNSERK